MGELRFTAEEDMTVGELLRVKNGVSRRLTASLKHQEGALPAMVYPSAPLTG